MNKFFADCFSQTPKAELERMLGDQIRVELWVSMSDSVSDYVSLARRAGLVVSESWLNHLGLEGIRQQAVERINLFSSLLRKEQWVEECEVGIDYADLRQMGLVV